MQRLHVRSNGTLGLTAAVAAFHVKAESKNARASRRRRTLKVPRWSKLIRNTPNKQKLQYSTFQNLYGKRTINYIGTKMLNSLPIFVKQSPNLSFVLKSISEKINVYLLYSP